MPPPSLSEVRDSIPLGRDPRLASNSPPTWPGYRFKNVTAGTAAPPSAGIRTFRGRSPLGGCANRHYISRKLGHYDNPTRGSFLIATGLMAMRCLGSGWGRCLRTLPTPQLPFPTGGAGPLAPPWNCTSKTCCELSEGGAIAGAPGPPPSGSLRLLRPSLANRHSGCRRTGVAFRCLFFSYLGRCGWVKKILTPPACPA